MTSWYSAMTRHFHFSSQGSQLLKKGTAYCWQSPAFPIGLLQFGVAHMFLVILHTLVDFILIYLSAKFCSMTNKTDFFFISWYRQDMHVCELRLVVIRTTHINVLFCSVLIQCDVTGADPQYQIKSTSNQQFRRWIGRSHLIMRSFYTLFKYRIKRYIECIIKYPMLNVRNRLATGNLRIIYTVSTYSKVFTSS
jgi:hypothetical protein